MIAIIIHPGIIRFYPGDFIIANVQTQRAAAAAVYRTGAPDDALFTLCRLLNGRRSGTQTERKRESTGGERQWAYRRRFD